MKKRQFGAEYKTKIVLEILQGDEQIGAIAARESISRGQLQNWKKEFLENASRAFSQNKDEKEAQQNIGLDIRPRFILLMVKLLIPVISIRSRFFMSLSIRSFHSFL
ncbi:MAG: transposase [Oscillospiraceae bacterium]|jgi:hypothetical protein